MVTLSTGSGYKQSRWALVHWRHGRSPLHLMRRTLQLLQLSSVTQSVRPRPLADKREVGILLRGGGGERANDCQTHAVATRFRSSGKTFFLRGLTGRRCSGDDVEGDETSGLAGGFDGLGMFWHRAAAESKQSIIRNPQSTMDDLIESCRGR